jgi:predicted Zn-dependent protease with MMP-like domain
MVHASGCRHNLTKSISSNSHNLKKDFSLPCCGSDSLSKLFKEKSKSQKKNLKSLPPSSVKIIKIPNNPYLSSITGKYAFDLSKIKDFSLYFWKSTDDPSINEAIQLLIEQKASSSPYDWPEYYKEQTLNALTQYTSFLNKSSSITESYEKSDIVCILFDTKDIGAITYLGDLYNNPILFGNKLILYINNILVSDENITQGGIYYTTLIHEFGHAFGLSHLFSNEQGSTIMPGIGNIECFESGLCRGSSFFYPSIAGYINNSGFNSVMSYNLVEFFNKTLPDYVSNKVGYPQTIMPLDASALRWMYNLKSAGNAFVSKYGVKNINPAVDEQKTQMIVGKNQEITFGSNCNDINFYFSNNSFSFNNLQPVKYQYNRIIEKPGTFYPQDLCSTVAKLNLKNNASSNIFIEKNALKTNLCVNCFSNTVLNVYIIDCKNRYSIKGSTYTDKKTGKKMTINNTSGATINVFFNK